MSSSKSDVRVAEAKSVAFTDDSLVVELADGRTLSVPLNWYPRLAHATPEERGEWQLLAHGTGIHWPQLDEDVSLEGLLAGKPSGESPRSLERWLETRKRQRLP